MGSPPFLRPLKWAVSGRYYHEAVVADPGVHAEEIGRRLDLASSPVLHHLRVLCREGLLVRVAVGRVQHLFPQGRWSPAAMRKMAASRTPGLQELLIVLEQNPGLTLAKLAEAAGLTPQRASKSARRLEWLRLVQKRREGRTVLHYPA